jgi:hypothetical protein
VDEPLVLNGVETGRICCRLEAWWMDEATAKNLGAHAHHSKRNVSAENGPYSGGDSSDFTELNGTTIGKTADGRNLILKGRKEFASDRRKVRFGKKSLDK